MFGEFFLPHAQKVADGRTTLMEATAEIVREASSRREMGGGEWTDVSGMLETAVDNLKDKGRGVKADGTNAEQLFDNKDIEKKMDAVLGEGNVLELTGGNYRTMYPVANAHDRRIDREYAKVNDETLSPEARQNAQDRVDRYMAQTIAFADRDDIPDRDKEIMANGVHNKRMNPNDPNSLTKWEYAQTRRGSEAFRQAHLEYGPTNDPRGRPVPAGGAPAGGGNDDDWRNNAGYR
jgi:hypothetical protein